MPRENYWVINLNDFDASSKYRFRVRGINDLGAGKWSSQNLVMPLVSSSKLDTVHIPTILGATIPTFIMSFIILLSCLTMSMYARLYDYL
ncbi:hypothetical protein Avbf_16268 [Armadillidium vulgare]|nr:hypothetical protein Avbf_16268 [Armadillidium vulgare]